MSNLGSTDPGSVGAESQTLHNRWSPVTEKTSQGRCEVGEYLRFQSASMLRRRAIQQIQRCDSICWSRYLIASYCAAFCALCVLLWPLLNRRDGHEKTQKEKSPDYETLKRSTLWGTSGEVHYGFHCNPRRSSGMPFYEWPRLPNGVLIQSHTRQMPCRKLTLRQTCEICHATDPV